MKLKESGKVPHNIYDFVARLHQEEPEKYLGIFIEKTDDFQHRKKKSPLLHSATFYQIVKFHSIRW